jgi:hypothetical protein
MKKMQNIYMMEQQKDLAAKYRNLDNTNKWQPIPEDISFS